MRYPQILLTFYKKGSPSEQRGLWANYDDHGKFSHFTNFYGENLVLLKDNTVIIDFEIWVLKDHLNRSYVKHKI